MRVSVIGICVVLVCFPPLSFAGLWRIHSIDSRQRGADGVRLADVNGDGLPDIACGWEEARETRIYLHPGRDSVTGQWPQVVAGKSGGVEDAVFGDIDNDGAVDVISSSENQAIFLHWAPRADKKYLEQEAWQTQVLPCSRDVQNWMITVPFQIDGKNGIDLLAAGKSNQVVWFEAPEEPRNLSRWRMHVITESGGWTMGLKAVDMDGDGDRDALLGIRNKHPGVKWFENPGPGARQKRHWRTHKVGPQGTAMGFVEVSDLDGDGYLDVIAPAMGTKAVMVYRGLNNCSTDWQRIEIELPQKRNKGIAVGDIDLDGRDDLVVSQELAEIAWLSCEGQIGSGDWSYHKVATGGKFDDVQLYDVDSDGDIDIFTTDEGGKQVVWCENPLKNNNSQR